VSTNGKIPLGGDIALNVGIENLQRNQYDIVYLRIYCVSRNKEVYMATEFIANGASGFNPDVDTALQLTDSEENIFKLKALTDSGFEILRNGVRTAPFIRVVAKTGATYTVLDTDHGTLFTNEGNSGNINFTLPATADLPTGWFVEFFSVAAGTLTVTAGTADTLVVFNDASADSIAFSTTSEIIGAHIKVVKLTTSLIGVFVGLGAETQTPTIVTA